MSSSVAGTGEEKEKDENGITRIMLAGSDATGPDLAAGNGFSLYIFAIFSDLFRSLGLGGLFGNDNFLKDLGDAAKPENLVTHPEFVQAASPELARRLTSGHIGRDEAVTIAADNRDAAVRTAVSIGFEKYAEDAASRGVRYGFGVKDGVRSIDCSGFVKKAMEEAAGCLENSRFQIGERGVLQAAFDNALVRGMGTHSDGQIARLAREGGNILEGDQINMNTLRAGMIIGMDTRDTGWDRGRERGIDHVVLVYRDTETGKLKVAQSSSSGGGVNIQDADEWLRRNSRHKLYAVDTVPLAQAEYTPNADVQVAAAPADNQIAANKPTTPAASI